MENTNSGIGSRLGQITAIEDGSKGMMLGLVAVLAFSLTLPATRIVVRCADPAFAGLGRISGAGIVAVLLLAIFRPSLPDRRQFMQLAVVALGVVVGFPLFSSFAMSRTDAIHGSVVIGIIPLFTAVAGSVIFGERPSILFWITSAAGCGLILAFVLGSGGNGISFADGALLAAVVSAAIGYAVGGNLARSLGGWQVICWALAMTLPFAIVPTFNMAAKNIDAMSVSGWAALSYLAIVSQLLAFFAWNKGMALGGIAKVGQVQLIQPFVTIALSAMLLGERFEVQTLVFALLVVATVAIGKRAPVRSRTSR